HLGAGVPYGPLPGPRRAEHYVLARSCDRATGILYRCTALSKTSWLSASFPSAAATGAWPVALRRGQVPASPGKSLAQRKFRSPTTGRRRQPPSSTSQTVKERGGFTNEVGLSERRMRGLKTGGGGPPQSCSRRRGKNRKGPQRTPASSRTKRTPGWRSQM